MGYYSPHCSNCGLFVKKMQVCSDVKLCFSLSIISNKTSSTLKLALQAIQSYFSSMHNKTTCDKKLGDCLNITAITASYYMGGA